MPEQFSEPPSGLQTFLLYDPNCGPCTSFMKIVTGFDFRKKIIPISIHGREAETLVRGFLSTTRLKSSFHIVEVSERGTRVYSAGDGLVRLTMYTPAGVLSYGIISRVKPLRQLVRWSYFQVTRLRNTAKSCSVPPEA